MGSTFGEIVKEARHARGITLERMAKRIGTGKPYLRMIERGKANPPSPRFVKKIATTLGLDLLTLLALAHAQKAPMPVREKFVEFAFNNWK